MNKARLAVIAAVSILVAVRCGSNSGGAGAGVATTLKLLGPARYAAFTCNGITVAINDAAGSPAKTNAAATVSLAVSRGALIAASAATWSAGTAITHLTVAAGATFGTVYLRTGSGPVTLTATATGLTKATLAVTPVPFVFGQPDASTIEQLSKGLYPWAVSIGGGKMVVSEVSRNRVLVWNALPTSATDTAALVLGQTSLSSDQTLYPNTSPSSLAYPEGVWTDGTKVVVADTESKRLLVWNTFPTTNGQPPDFALGVPAGAGNLTTVGSGNVTASTFIPHAIHSDGTRLYVSDRDNKRVLVWSTFPTTAGQAADFALGVPGGGGNLTSVGGGTCVAAEFGVLTGITTLGSRLFLADNTKHRVLAWSTIPTAGGQAADYALGQPDLTTCTTPGAASATTMYYPYGIGSDGTRLFVTDVHWSRTLVWSAAPTTNGEAASLVLGQPDFTGTDSNSPSLSGSTLNGPFGATGDGTRLFLADQSNSRVLVWSAFPTSNGQSATFAVGTAAGAGNLTTKFPVSLSGANLNLPFKIHSDGTRLFVVDYLNHRVLVWKIFPTDPSQPADFALGQPAGAANLTSNGYGTTASSLQNPVGVTTAGGKLYVSDLGNSRVLGWNTIPTTGGQPADFVLGQPDFVSGSINQGGGPTASTLSYPHDVTSDGTRLFLADGQRRVLVWNTLPTTTAQPADLVLGQPDFVTTTGVTTASGMKNPIGLVTAGGRLYVVDNGNHRVMVWNTLPTTNGQAADFALGQPAGGANLTSGTANNGGVSASSFNYPNWIHSDGTRLAVSDFDNNRVLVWTSLPTTGGQAADAVLGQADFTSHLENRGGAPSASSLYQPAGVLIMNGGVFVSDQTNYRVIAMPLP